MPETAVLDASAVLDAATPGERFGAFTLLAERFAAVAPALLAWEIASVVHGRRRESFGKTTSRRSETIELLLAGIEMLPSDEGSRARTGALAERHGLTFYDASYLELAARDEATVLVTQDRALLAAAARVLGKGRASDLDGVPRLVASLDL